MYKSLQFIAASFKVLNRWDGRKLYIKFLGQLSIYMGFSTGNLNYTIM